MEGKIKEEELKKRVLEIQYEHEQIVARTAGEAGSGRVRTFLQSLGEDLSLEQKLQIFNIIEKKESIKDLSNGNVTLFCTPQDVNLNLGAFGHFDHINEKAFQNLKQKTTAPSTTGTSMSKERARVALEKEQDNE